MVANITSISAALRADEPHSHLAPETVRRIADSAPAADRQGAFPWEGIRAVHAAGLLEATVGAHYGGQGASLTTTARILSELGRADPSVALISSMTLFAHLAQATRSLWPETVYRQLLEQTASRPILINAARVEPELGSPSRGGVPATLARRVPGGWSISGAKRFVTGSEGLTHILVWARTDEASLRVGTFIVAADTPGIAIQHNWNSLGMRATSSHDVLFTDVQVPEDHVIGLVPVDQAEQDNRAHAPITLALTAIYLGVAEAAQEVFTRFAHERVPANLGRPIATTERIIAAAGEIEFRIATARDAIFDALTDRIDQPEALVRARLLAGRHIKEAVQIAVNTLGNPGMAVELGLERHFRNAQATLVHAPQEDIGISILGRAALDRNRQQHLRSN